MSAASGAHQPAGQWACAPLPLRTERPVPSDSAIARQVRGKTIGELCSQLGIRDYEPMGAFKAKLPLTAAAGAAACTSSGSLGQEQLGAYVVVTALTPTSLGEGKSTTTIGLAQALQAHLNRNTFACIRQPSQGPTFGLKGGAAGGGYSQVWPMDEFNLHLTGDVHAIGAANNLIAAAVEARMFHEATQSDEDLFRRLVERPRGGPGFTEAQRRRLTKLQLDPNLEPQQLQPDQRRLFARLDIDPQTVAVARVLDTNDRFLRQLTLGQAPTEKGHTRTTKFTISVASELMAILALASDLEDVCRRVERMVVGFSRGQPSRPVTCDDLCVAGAACALIRDAVKPTLIQTLEGSPVLVHCGPFANIAHGNSSIIADQLALRLVGPRGFVVTEAGFGSDIGFEKFMDIKCRASGLRPHCAVLVATLRALKAHGRDLLHQQRQPHDNQAGQEHQPEELLEAGMENLRAHIRNISTNFRTPLVVAINKFAGDSQHQLELVTRLVLEAGADHCCVANNWAEGGQGALELAKRVAELCDQQTGPPKACLLYDDHEPAAATIEQKLALVASRVYGAAKLEFSERARAKLQLLEANGFGHLPVCIAKTQMSISHDPKLKGAPSGYTFPIADLDVSAGAGFVYALAGEVSTMPGLPTRPAFFDITLDPASGQVDGLF